MTEQIARSERVAGLLVGAAWAGMPEPERFVRKVWLEGFEFGDAILDREPTTAEAWQLLIDATFAAALRVQGRSPHLHSWFSESARTWIPEWLTRAPEPWRLELRRVRSRLQDVFSLGINLRRRDSAACRAALHMLRSDMEFCEPSDHRPPSALLESSCAVAAASWAGRRLPAALALLNELDVDRVWLAALAGALFGRRGLSAEWRLLGADVEAERWEAAAISFKTKGASVEDRVESLLAP